MENSSYLLICDDLTGFDNLNRNTIEHMGDSAPYAELEAFFNSPRVEVLLHDLETADYYALIVKRLKAKGRPISTNDIWIAANAMKHGLALYSFDNHFEKTKGLLLLSTIRNGA